MIVEIFCYLAILNFSLTAPQGATSGQDLLSSTVGDSPATLGEFLATKEFSIV